MKILRPMLADTVEAPAEFFIQSPIYAGEQKVDGDRCLIHVDDGRVAAYSRNGKTARSSARIVKAFAPFAQGGNRWVFDGELIGGVYWIFDLIEAGDKIRPWQDHTDHGDDFETRRDTLEVFLNRIELPDFVRLVPSYRTTAEKQALYDRMQSEGCEGVVFKRLDAPYRCGKRVGEYFAKVKFRHEVDCWVSDQNIGGSQNYQMSVYDEDGEPFIIGEVTALAGDKSRIQLDDVIRVVYLYAAPETRKLIQPTYPRIRTDKTKAECTIDQLVYPNKTVHN